MLSESAKTEVLERFDRDVFEYEQEIMKIKKHREDIETKRNQDLKEANTKHYEMIQQNAEETYAKVLKVDKKFQTYLEASDCEVLATKLSKFKAECEELLSMKRDLINRIWTEVKTSEEDYVKAINVFLDEFNNMVFKSKNEYIEMRAKATEYLAQLERDLLAQRTRVLKQSKEEVNGLFKQHEKTEASFVELREQEENKNFKELNQLRQEKSKDFFDLKVFLENEIQNHEKCLEDMKAIYQLNAEKLNYNFKVLSEKKDENSAMSAVLKKKERFFVNLLKRKNDEYKLKDEEYKKINKKLTDQNKNITKQYKELHRKFEYFEVADVERFEQVKEMSLKEITDLKQRISACNSVILQQQLDMDIELTQYNNDQDKENNGVDTKATLELSYAKDNSEAQGQGAKIESSTPEEQLDGEGDVIDSDESKRQLFDFIIGETKFLMDDKLLSEIEACGSDAEATILKLDLIKKVFSLKSDKEINELLRLVHSRCLDETTGQYDIDEFIGVLTELLDLSKKRGSSKVTKSMLNIRKAEMSDVDSAIRENEWERLAKVLDDTTLDIWHGLNKFSTKYYTLLKERKETIEKNKAIKKENAELEELLQQYMRKNHRLIFPPVL